MANAGAALGFVHDMSGHHDGAPLGGQRFQMIPNVAAMLRIEPHGGLVQHEYGRLVNQGHRQRETPLHAAGVVVHELLAMFVQAHEGEKLVHAACEALALHAVERREETQVLLAVTSS